VTGQIKLSECRDSVAFFFPLGRKIIVWLRRAVASNAHPRCIEMFESLIQNKKAETVDTVSAFLCLFDTIDIARMRSRVSRFVSIFLPDRKKNKCVAPSSRRQRRSSAPHLKVRISYSKEKSRNSRHCFCFFVFV
jgi:hypothetical protein